MPSCTLAMGGKRSLVIASWLLLPLLLQGWLLLVVSMQTADAINYWSSSGGSFASASRIMVSSLREILPSLS
uniref:Putative secreted protein n=1 Tax=Anopheles darlingi TaxID=43151 RepID=A0A2M4DMV1_ANODA